MLRLHATPTPLGDHDPSLSAPYYFALSSPLFLHSYNSQPGVGVRVLVPVHTVAQFRPDEKEWRMTVLCTVRGVCVCSCTLRGWPAARRTGAWTWTRVVSTTLPWYLQLQFTPCVRLPANVPSVQLRTRA